MNAPFDRSVFSLILAAGVFLGGPAPAAAQAAQTAQTGDNPAAAPPPAVRSSPLRRKPAEAGQESPEKSASGNNAGAKGGSSPMDAMKDTSAPKSGAMPLGGGLVPAGKIGTAPTATGKLGTPPDPNNTDRPPRPN